MSFACIAARVLHAAMTLICGVSVGYMVPGGGPPVRRWGAKSSGDKHDAKPAVAEKSTTAGGIVLEGANQDDSNSVGGNSDMETETSGVSRSSKWRGSASMSSGKKARNRKERLEFLAKQVAEKGYAFEVKDHATFKAEQKENYCPDD